MGGVWGELGGAGEIVPLSDLLRQLGIANRSLARSVSDAAIWFLSK